MIVLAVFLAVFTQSVSGFGVALVAMALLPGLIGIQIATPLVALVATTVEVVLFIRYRNSLNIQAVWRIILAALIGIPIGILTLKNVDPKIVLRVLGIVISGYSAYALLDIRLPELNHPLWAYGAGLVSGILGGAYNTSGPPVIVYGDCRRWPPQEFKSNLQGFFLVSSVLIMVGHGLGGNFNSTVLKDYLVVLPAIATGTVAGISLDRFINPPLFRKVVLVLLIIMGLRLIF